MKKSLAKQKGFIPIVIGLLISMLYLIVCYGVGMGFLSMFSNLFTGAANSYGNCGSSGDVTCPSGTLAGIVRDKENIARINKNMDFYKQVAQASNVPWEVIAGIQYRETSNDTSHKRSWANGYALCNNSDSTYVNFKAKHGHACSGELDDAIGAMDELQSKVGGRLRSNVWDEDLIKKAMFGYNGMPQRYYDQAVALGFPKNPGYDGSPYVMANFDERHAAKKYRKCCNDGCHRYDYCESQDGGFTVASLLKNAEFDSSGKIVSLGGCSAAGSGGSTASSSSCIGEDTSLNGTMGANLTGAFYPPYGDKMKTIVSVNDKPHGKIGHGVFTASGFGDGFQDVDNGAIDYNVPDGSHTPVYAAFDGTIVNVKPMHHSTYGRGGGLIWLKSTDGNYGAIYAHITFVNGIAKGKQVKRGEQIAIVAPRCGHNVDQCVDFHSGEHLHFQFYVQKVGRDKAQLLTLFPYK